MRIRSCLLGLPIAAAGLLAGVGGTVDAAASMSIASTGRLEDGGSAARVKVRVACDPVGDVVQPLEAHLTLSQDDQAIFGQGGIAGVVCDGRLRWYVAQVHVFDGAFHRGTAHGSGFVLICDETGSTCEQAQASRDIKLVGVTG